MEYLEWKLKIQIIFGRKIKIRQNVGDKIQILLSSLIDFRRENSNSSVSFFCWSPRIFCSNDALFDLNYTAKKCKAFSRLPILQLFLGWSLKADTHTVWKSSKMSHFWYLASEASYFKYCFLKEIGILEGFVIKKSSKIEKSEKCYTNAI